MYYLPRHSQWCSVGEAQDNRRILVGWLRETVAVTRTIALLAALSLATVQPSRAQTVGVALSGAVGRTEPRDRSILDREASLGVTLVHRPLATRSLELHVEAGGSSRQRFIAESFRRSVTLSQAVRAGLGPVGLSAIAGIGLQRTRVNALLESPDISGMHGRFAGRVDSGVVPGLRVFAEASLMYAYVLPSGRRAIDRIAAPSPPCDNGFCVNPFRDAATLSLRVGGMALLF
jgi:hypothetical protein